MNLIHKLRKIDKFIYLTVKPKTIKSTVYLENNVATKIASIPCGAIFNITEDFEPFKMSFYDADKLSEILKDHFINTDTSAVITLIQEEDGLYAESIKLQNNKLKITITCADSALSFLDMSQEQIDKATSKSKVIYTYPITSDKITELKNLFKLDKNSPHIKLQFKDNGIYVNGVMNQEFESHWVEIQTNCDGNELYIKKSFFELLDKEDYEVDFCERKTIWSSLNSETVCVFANTSRTSVDE